MCHGETQNGGRGSQLVCMYVCLLSDYVSWRNTERGTWFIQAVVYVFSHLAHKYDLLQLMTRVSRMLGQPYLVGCWVNLIL